MLDNNTETFDSNIAAAQHIEMIAAEYQRRLSEVIAVENSDRSVLVKKLICQKMTNQIIQDYQEDLGRDLSRKIEQHLQLVRSDKVTVEAGGELDDEFTLREFLDRRMELFWLSPSFFTLGSMYILAAKAKSGKTDFINYLARSVTITGDFLGMPCTKGKVLLFQVEESQVNIKLKGKRHGYVQSYEKDDEHNLHDVVIVRSLDLANDFNKFEAKIKKHRPVLVILDTIRGVMSRSGLNECHAGYADVFYAVQALAIRYNITIICLHHTTKAVKDNEGADPLDSVAGTSKLPGIGDGTLVMKREENSNNVVVNWITRDIGRRTLVLKRQVDEMRRVNYTVVKELGVSQSCLDQEMRILCLLKIHENLTEKQLSTYLGAFVGKTIDRLCEHFLIDYFEEHEQLVYFIPPDALPLWENTLTEDAMRTVELAVQMSEAEDKDDLIEIAKQHNTKEKKQALDLLPEEEKLGVLIKRYPPQVGSHVNFKGQEWMTEIVNYVQDPEQKHPIYTYRLCSTMGEEYPKLVSESDLLKEHNEQLQHDSQGSIDTGEG